jgi:hypothetical protein
MISISGIGCEVQPHGERIFSELHVVESLSEWLYHTVALAANIRRGSPALDDLKD